MGNYFCGWYFRCQSGSQTLAVIPAVHRSGTGQSCSIQLITDDASWYAGYPISDFQKSGPVVQIGENRFGPQGIQLELHTAGLHASGSLRFGPLTPIGYDIMGPFRWVPGMECRHSVFSMRHSVNGEVLINGKSYFFRHGTGYWEGDRGRSFPEQYAWTQCSFREGAVMLSMAEIPLGRLRFTGTIGVVLWRGTQYRLATYLGAKVLRNRNGEIVARQGRLQLTVRLLEDAPRPLAAPTGGAMVRTIHEHAACRAYYCFQTGSSILFAREAPDAAFEYEFPRE